jgi:adenine-specific DNA-methyltransferase
MNIEKLDLQSPDLVNENIEKIATLFPNCVTEGNEGKSIDFDLLKQELSHSIVEGNKERYRLEWPGKKEAIVTANLPTSKTLRPVREDSVDFDNTENIYIEGDNLEVLKLLQESYLGKIKMIYIDPPYNTGKDFVYKDNFAKDTQDELLQSGQKDEYNQRLVVNPETAGRYHSDWLSMMYPRLKLVRNLLTVEGVIFMSIGEEELSNSEHILNEIFGQQNKISIVTRVVKTASNLGTHFAPSTDFILCYAKNIDNLPKFKDKVDESLYKKIELDGARKGQKFRDDIAFYQSSQKDIRPNQKYFVTCPDGEKVLPPCSIQDEVMREGDGRWRWSKETYLLQKDLIVFKQTKTSPLINEDGKNAKWNLYTKSYLKDRQVDGTLPRNFQTDFINRKGADLIKRLGIEFDFSKPIELIEFLIQIVELKKDDIILDFFAGSSSTAHGILKWNAENGTSLKYLMVQLPELIDNKEFKTISELSKERIRRAAKKIKEDTNAEIDYGFRVYRLDDSNMQDVYYKPQDYVQTSLDLCADNVKVDRTSDDLLAQVMLDWGLPLSLRIETKEICGKQVFRVAENSLFACFDEGIDDDFAKELASEMPLRVVFKDSAFKDDTAKTNVKQLLKQLSPNTEMKVI